jgi:hypothetical protein
MHTYLFLLDTLIFYLNQALRDLSVPAHVYIWISYWEVFWEGRHYQRCWVVIEGLTLTKTALFASCRLFEDLSNTVKEKPTGWIFVPQALSRGRLQP